MIIADFLRRYFVPSRIELSLQYVTSLASTVRLFSRWIGREAELTDFSERTICEFLAVYRKTRSASSTNHHRCNLIVLWQATYDQDLIDRPPHTRRIRKLKTNPDSPVAWTVEEIAQILGAAGMLDGMVAGIPAALWWTAILLTLFWSGCRVSAMLATESDCYRRGQGVTVRHQKNHRPQWYALPASCCAAIDATEPQGRRLLFPYDKTKPYIYSDFRRIIERSGLVIPRRGLNLFHKLRRTTLSYCAASDPALAQRQAGHASYRTTQESYIDPTIANVRSAADVLPDPLAVAPLYQSHKFRIFG